jgi:hypothetical protein
MKIAAPLLTTGAAALISLLAVAPAAACGGDTSGPVVEHGVSSGGQMWTQKACPNGNSPELLVDIYLPQRDGEDVGGGTSGLPPSRRLPLLVDAPGDDIGPGAEGELDGATFQTVTRVRIAFAAGPPIVVPTRPAPGRTRRRFAYLRQLRFFVVFFPGPRSPTSVTALNNAGHVLARWPVH